MTNPENPFDRAEQKREESRDSSFFGRIKRKIKQKKEKQAIKEKQQRYSNE